MGRERTDLTGEAVKINGRYIEDQIEGYMTLKATGREALSLELETRDLPGDGSVLEKTRFPMRVIEVEYLLVAESFHDFVEKFNRLMGLLNVIDGEIIFNNEPDKYYKGSLSSVTDIERYQRARKGKYTITCVDPFKYEATETEVSETEITLEGETVKVLDSTNTGTYKAYPRFEIQFAKDSSASGVVGSRADCGYALLAKGGTDYSLQVGNDQEKDIISSVRVNQDFTKSARGSFADANSTPVLASTHVYNGSSKVTSTGLQINATTNVTGKYHGPCVVFTLPTPAAGAFTFEWKHVLACHKTATTGKKEGGAFWVALLDTSNHVVFAEAVHKTNTTKTVCTQYSRISGGKLETDDTSCNVSYTGLSGYKSTSDTTGRLSTCVVKRYQNSDGLWNYDFNTNWQEGGSWNYGICPAVAKIVFFFGKYDNHAGFSHNRVTWARFTDGSYDQLNTFKSGDKVDINTSDMTILLNGKNAADLGDISNDWSEMALDVGNNQILCQYSDWVEDGFEPTFKMYYRKRYL